jgi:hypothetical protein
MARDETRRDGALSEQAMCTLLLYTIEHIYIHDGTGLFGFQLRTRNYMISSTHVCIAVAPAPMRR